MFKENNLKYYKANSMYVKEDFSLLMDRPPSHK